VVIFSSFLECACAFGACHIYLYISLCLFTNIDINIRVLTLKASKRYAKWFIWAQIKRVPEPLPVSFYGAFFLPILASKTNF